MKLTPKELAERNNKIADELAKKVVSATKKSIGYAESLGTSYSDGTYSVTVECPEPKSMAEVASEIVNHHERCTVNNIVLTPGKFDWQSDYYIKPSYQIFFSIK